MTVDVGALATELLDRSNTGQRVIVGICGAPGAGKSTLAELLVAEVNGRLPGSAVAVGMDGFHLARSVIDVDDRRSRRGAPDTFDAVGYAALLARLRSAEDDVVYAPEYRRDIEDPVNAAIAVPRSVRVVVTEGNYLLHPDWVAARESLDHVWYLEAPDDSVRVEQLVARHVRFGKDPERARSWVLLSDEANARLVASHRDRADRVLRWSSWQA